MQLLHCSAGICSIRPTLHAATTMLSRVAPAPTQMNGFLLIIITTAETRPRSFPLYEKKHDRGVDTQREEGACCTASLSTVLVQCTLPLHAVSSGVVPAPSSPLKHGVLLSFSQQTHLHPVQVETFPTMILNKNEKDRTTTLHPLDHAPPPTLPHSNSPSQHTHGTTICK